MNFYVAGVKHHQVYEICNEIKEGVTVELIPEPKNKYDKFAVKILFNDFTLPDAYMLGYVPATLSESISKKIKEGKHLTAKITNIDLEKEPWYALRIKIEEIN